MKSRRRADRFRGRTGHPYLRLTRVLEENFVVTMEPGLYFIDQLLEQARADHRGAKINWARVEHFRPFGGIRIEDNLAITANGCENLTRDAFAELASRQALLSRTGARCPLTPLAEPLRRRQLPNAPVR